MNAIQTENTTLNKVLSIGSDVSTGLSTALSAFFIILTILSLNKDNMAAISLDIEVKKHNKCVFFAIVSVMSLMISALGLIKTQKEVIDMIIQSLVILLTVINVVLSIAYYLEKLVYKSLLDKHDKSTGSIFYSRFFKILMIAVMALIIAASGFMTFCHFTKKNTHHNVYLVLANILVAIVSIVVLVMISWKTKSDEPFFGRDNSGSGSGSSGSGSSGSA